ncbi:copper resistance system multicopper oxidase [Sphingomicrobium sediminis]|uniref:Copper resistance system multicopper oxidase n=1 Tax=Sphingomicrobium sediminis TaxID=2950949 RepID=A0A9X2EHV7_9SPHN|nr:copper resistance system multicopper oxidase [Sphingomicrobium sediminis]MCM8558330.1 copper resistance system multicopper oxidase [Sphingomicrobium sediminis]
MPQITRRSLLGAGLAGGALATAIPAWARGGDVSHGAMARRGFDEAAGPRVDLTVARSMFGTGGKTGHAVTVNGSVPGPLLRLKEGTDIALAVHNHVDEDTSIHWHGLLVPFHLDGVPGVSFPGIKPGETFVAEFPVRQSGTYWWHSHSGLQEQAGHYGPIIVDPAGPDPIEADRDYVVLLSEFTPLHPHTIFKKLKQGEGYFNYQQRSWTDDYPLSAEDRRMWAQMRMMPTDILDVTAATYTYMINGHGPMDALEYAFRPGERVRLRFINAGAMTFFNVRIPGLPMSVVQADGKNVKPVEVDEFQIAPAETYDVIVEPTGEAHTLVAESMDRSGMALAHLASRPGARTPIPPLRKPPLLTMKDMGHGGMDHGAMGHGDGGMEMGGMDMRDTSLLPPTVRAGPGVDMVAMNPVDRMGDPGVGLDDVDHRVLRYTDLRALKADHSVRAPTRAMEIHLTGNMERYMWSFDGKRFAAVADEPIRFAYNERVRIKLVNDTMMAHPIHLHGHFFELVNGAGHGEQPLKHTMIVQPGGSAVFDLTADEPGDWAFHCHLLYHMHAGMFQIVTVANPDGSEA